MGLIAAIGSAISAIASAIGFAAMTIGGALGISAMAVAYGIAGGLLIGVKSILGGKKKTDPSRSMLDRLNANLDLRAPRKTVVGHTAFATDIRDEELTGDDQDLLHRWMVLASHEVHSIDEVWFEDKQAWVSGTDMGIGDYGSDWLRVNPCLMGDEPSAMDVSSRMPTGSRRFTGMAWIHFRFRCAPGDESPFGSSVPTRITVRGKGALFYDPRKDSTVPGGSGLHRTTDQSTWEWDDDACRNPALTLLFYLLGWRIENPDSGEWLLAVGKGIPQDRINLESFAVAANLCDEEVDTYSGGTEPRYRCDGVWSEGDPPQTVIDMITASMNADLDDVDGQLRLTVFHNDLDVIDAEFTAADVLDDFEWEPDLALDESSNITRGVYTDPSNASLYQTVDYPQVESESPDGIDRIDTFNIPMVQSADQAQRLARLRMARELYGSGTFKANFQATAWKVQKNSIVTLTFPKRNFVNKLFRVAEMDLRVDGVVPLILREESPSIYDPPELLPAIDPYDAYPRNPTTSPVYDVLRDLNDLNSDPITAPVIATDGTAVDHTLRTDGSADISFEWSWSGAEPDIDGFEVLVYASSSASAYTPGTTPAQEMVYAMMPDRRAIILTGCPADLYWTFAVTAYRVVSPSIDPTGIIRSTRVKPTLTAENPYQPSTNVAFAGNVTGTINGIASGTVSTAITNFNANNDRNGTTPVSPTIVTTGAAVDHVINTDGSADISFEWQYTPSATPGSSANIDGYVITVYSSTSSGAYTFGTTPEEEAKYYVPAAQKSFIIRGVPANKYYTFGVQAYRFVDTDINSVGAIFSSLIKPGLGAENPYLPSANVAFAGDVTGTINSTAVATVVSGAAAANLGLDSSGNVKTNKVGYSAIVLGSVTSHLTMQSGTTTYGSGSMVTLVSGSFTLADAGEVFVLWSAKQAYTSGTPGWGLEIYIDGVLRADRGGNAVSDAPACTFARSLAAGSHTIDVKWRGNSGGINVSGDTTYVQGNLR